MAKKSKKSNKEAESLDGDRSFRKRIKKTVRKIMEECDPQGLSLQDVRADVKKKLLKSKSPENVAKFNALVDSAVSHFQRKARETSSSSKPSGVLKPILRK